MPLLCTPVPGLFVPGPLGLARGDAAEPPQVPRPQKEPGHQKKGAEETPPAPAAGGAAMF